MDVVHISPGKEFLQQCAVLFVRAVPRQKSKGYGNELKGEQGREGTLPNKVKG